MLSRLESGRNPAGTDLHGLWPAKALREALWPTYHLRNASKVNNKPSCSLRSVSTMGL
jgi:hypothetical protein